MMLEKKPQTRSKNPQKAFPNINRQNAEQVMAELDKEHKELSKRLDLYKEMRKVQFKAFATPILNQVCQERFSGYNG